MNFETIHIPGPLPEGLEEQAAELQRLLAAEHRAFLEHIRPITEHLVRIESMRLPGKLYVVPKNP